MQSRGFVVCPQLKSMTFTEMVVQPTIHDQTWSNVTPYQSIKKKKQVVTYGPLISAA
jgi:hypothetical protein